MHTYKDNDKTRYFLARVIESNWINAGTYSTFKVIPIPDDNNPPMNKNVYCDGFKAVCGVSTKFTAKYHPEARDIVKLRCKDTIKFPQGNYLKAKVVEIVHRFNPV